MAIVSFNFLLFIVGIVVLYYVIPKRLQWPFLLLASLTFYALSDIRHIIFLVITAATVYAATLYMQKQADASKAYLAEHKEELAGDKERKNAIKESYQRKRRRVLVITLLLNFGILCSFKYIHFAIEQVNAVIGAFHGTPLVDSFSLLIPLGISFYTFQLTGYLIDVYWKKYPAQTNFAKVLLFTSFFPQITQGPISNYKDLTDELFKEHRYTYHNFSWGCQRLIWGFFKKLVVANVISVYTADVFANYGEYTGITVLIAAFLYAVQIYADFSGYMDIMCGLCQVLDIQLTENFLRPYFSKSVAEYWRRWHISLGAWFKTYLYYPIAVAKWNQRLGKRSRGVFGKAFGDYLPATISLVVVWFATGLWHGATWAYIIWGLLNGFFIIISLWLEKVYPKWKAALHVNEDSWWWRAFQTLRTFVLITFIKVFPDVGSIADGWGLWMQIFTNHAIPHSFSELFPYIYSGYFASSVIPMISFAVAMAGTLAMFIVSLVQRRKQIRERLDSWPLPLRALLYAFLIILIFGVGVPVSWDGIGFMYAQF